MWIIQTAARGPGAIVGSPLIPRSRSMLPARASPATGHKRRRKSLCRHHRHRQFNGFPMGHLVHRRASSAKLLAEFWLIL
jgi:hypothetical protein